jgi:hypothetical protein
MSKQDIHENLPWYINRQLSDKEIAEIELQLKDDPTLQREVDFLNALRDQLKQSAQASPGEFGLQRLMRDVQKEQNAQPLLKRWKTLAVAASLLMVVQTGIMVSMMGTEDNGIVPLSGSDYSGAVIQLQFREQATADSIQQLLLSLNGSIIEGPSANGVYRIRLQVTEPDAVNRQIEQLKSNTEVIDFAAVE